MSGMGALLQDKDDEIARLTALVERLTAELRAAADHHKAHHALDDSTHPNPSGQSTTEAPGELTRSPPQDGVLSAEASGSVGLGP